MSAIRREILRYLHDHGPMIVDKGAARQRVADEVYKVLNEQYDGAKRGSILYEMGNLARARALKEGDGARYAQRHYLAITAVGRRELAIRMTQSNEELDETMQKALDVPGVMPSTVAKPELSEPEPEPEQAEPEPEPELEQTEPHYDPIESLQARQDELNRDDFDATEDVADVPLEDESPPPAPAVDPDALAHALLKAVLQKHGESTQWVAEVERLEGELQAMRDAYEQRVEAARDARAQREEALRGELTTTQRELGNALIKLRDAESERDEAKRLHAKANEQIRIKVGTIERLRAENARRRTYPALSDEDQKALAGLAGTMREPPKPGVGGSDIK